MKILYTSLIFLFAWMTASSQVSYQGPEVGNVASGVVQTTDEFNSAVSLIEPADKKIRNKVEGPNEPYFLDVPTPPASSIIYVEDKNRESLDPIKTVLLKDFQGNPMGNGIPPDPHIAVGPDHIITTVNSTFRIYDKQGNLLKDITADSWCSEFVSSPDAFDPQIVYDHYENRWFMLWDNVNDATQTAYFMISVSDNSNPLGTWYSWGLPAHFNGNNNAFNWGDYPGVGFDSQAYYITSRQFGFNSGPKYYDKIRIISKAELYASMAGPLSWKDIWYISYPNGSGRPDGIRPCITYGPTTDAYILHTERGGGNAVNFYKISNPVTNPVLSGTAMVVPQYYAPPDANQLGGGSPGIAANGSNLMMAPRLFNGHLYVVHAVANNQHFGYSALRYMKIDPANATILDDFQYGAIGYFYLFPALDIDKDGNVAVNFSRSGDSEYAGAFYTSRLANDPPGFNPSYLLKPGGGNYVVTYGGLRNRWGDYHGMYRDPVDQNNFWMLTEYAHYTNRWGTWVGKIRLVPFPGTYVFPDKEEVNFSNIQVNNTSETISVTLKNYGEDDLIITNIPETVGQFKKINSLTFPVTLRPYLDSVIVQLQFAPVDTGYVEEIYTVTSNNTEYDGIPVKGKGYVINTAAWNILYASSGTNNGGNVLTINPFTGEGTIVGPALYPELKSIATDPVSKVIYGIYSGLTIPVTELVRVNAEKGDAYLVNLVKEGVTVLTDMSSIAFDLNGTLYGFKKTGQIYEIDKLTGAATLKSTSTVQIASAVFNPLSGELWASLYASIGSGKDKVYKIDKETGVARLIGQTGLGLMTNALIFDGAGELYGTTGNASQISNFIKIDTVSAAGTSVGPIAFTNITGFAYDGDKFTGVQDNEPAVVTAYSLGQNYPNPFNPSTVITYSLPYLSQVNLVVYNLLGEKVKTLVSSELTAGRHTVSWNGEDNAGTKVSSGIYFYELRAESPAGEKYNEMKKMILMK